MRNWILIIIPLLVWHQSSAAQDQVGCTHLFEDAKEAYAAGMVELVPELLLPCLESGAMSGTAKQDAYKLVINAYLFDYLPEEADSLMNDFVNDFPEYRSGDTDPAEFVLLLETHQKAKSIDPIQHTITDDVVTVDTGGETARPPDTRTQYRSSFDYGNSLGFILGVNGTFPQMVERYSIGDPTLDEGSFGLAPGFQVGAAMNLLLGEGGLEISFGLLYNRTRFTYAASPLAMSAYEYDEYQDHLQIPVSMIFKLNPASKGATVYLRVGVVADYLLAASGAGTMSYTESLGDVVVEKTSITDSRVGLNMHGMAGRGVRFPLENAFIFLETRFTSGIFLVNREENRYENQDLTWPRRKPI